EKAHRDWGYMGEVSGQGTVVDSSGYVDLEARAEHFETVVKIKAGERV
ncbi:deoxynucleoside kinase, partial [Vibrio parahaemolyticus]|nr:deoxynucleoside kinase [Vibrio parahaemolyticus]